RGKPSARQEIAYRCRDLGCVGLEREMAGINEAHDCLGDVAFESFRTCRQEKWVVLAPDGEERRLMSAEVLLEGRIQGNVALVVAEQIELHLVSAGAPQIEVVQGVAVRGNRRRVGYAVGVLPDSRLGLEKGA